MKESEKSRAVKEKDLPESENQAWGRLLHTAKASRWCLVYSYVLTILVMALVPFLLGFIKSWALDATSQMRALKPEWIHWTFSKLLWFVEIVAMYAALSYHWTTAFSSLDVYEGGLKKSEGWFKRRETVVPAGKIRSLTVTQTVLGKNLGFGDLEVDFGSSAGPLVCEGLKDPREIENRLSRVTRS